MSCHVRRNSFLLFAVGLFGLAAFALLAGAGREGGGGCPLSGSVTTCGQHDAAVVLSASEEQAPSAPAGAMCKGCAAAGGMCENCKGRHGARVETLSKAVTAIESARSAVESGEKETALAKLDEAHALVKGLHDEMLQRHAAMHGGKFVNTRCPMMGTPIHPDKVPASLIREYKGGNVAFCCGGCPAAWDKLSDAEKEAHLDKVRAAPETK